MKKADEKKTVLVMRIFIVFFIAISVFIALNPPTFIAQLMGYSWGALAGSFLAPFLYGLFTKKITKAAVWTNFAWGVGLTVANIFGKFIASPINCGAIAMVGGLIIVPLVSLITPKMEKSKLDEMFACYEEKVEVTKKMVLKDEE